MNTPHYVKNAPQYVLLPSLWFITIGCRGHRHYLIKVDRVLVTLQTVFRGQKIVFLVQVTGNSLKFIHSFLVIKFLQFLSFSIPYQDPLNY